MSLDISFYYSKNLVKRQQIPLTVLLDLISTSWLYTHRVSEAVQFITNRMT